MALNSVCILGGGGFVGHHLVNRLAVAGVQVRVSTRRRERVKDLLVLPTVTVDELDAHDPVALGQWLRGADAVVNLVGILHGDAAAFERAHAELPGKVVDACRQAGVGRLVHMSALGADPGSRSVYQRTKAQGEARVLAAQGEDLAVTVFRPSVIFGPGDSFLNLFADLLPLAPVLPLAGAAARFQPVYVGDVAHAFAQALDDPRTHGQVYNLCGPRVYTLEQLVRLTARQVGASPLILPLNQGLSYLFAAGMELKPGRKLMTRDNHFAMLTDNVCPEGFPEIFGAPTELEAVIGYLTEQGPRSRFDLFRCHARR